MKTLKVLTLFLALSAPARGAGLFELTGKVQYSRPVVVSGVVTEVLFSIRAGGQTFPAVCASADCVEVLHLAGETVTVRGSLARDERTGGIVLKAQELEVE